MTLHKILPRAHSPPQALLPSSFPSRPFQILESHKKFPKAPRPGPRDGLGAAGNPPTRVQCRVGTCPGSRAVPGLLSFNSGHCWLHSSAIDKGQAGVPCLCSRTWSTALCWGLEAVVGVSSTPPPSWHPVVRPTLTCLALSQALTIFCGYFCHHDHPKKKRLSEVGVPRSCYCQDSPVQHHLQHLPTYHQYPVAPIFPLCHCPAPS